MEAGCKMWMYTSVKNQYQSCTLHTIFLRPNKFVLKVSLLYTLFLALLVLYVISAHVRKTVFFLCFAGVCVLGMYFRWFLCCFNSAAVFTVNCKYSLFIPDYS